MAGGRPGRKCTICHDPRVAAINEALLAGQRANDIAGEYRVSPDALSRHKLSHLAPVASGDDAVALTASGPNDILGSVADLQNRVLALLRKAERARDLRGALACIREASNLLTLAGRLSGQIKPDGAVVNVGVLAGGEDQGTAEIRERIAGKLAALAGRA